MKLLQEEFQLAGHQVRRIVSEAAGLDLIREREFHWAAFFTDEPRLTRLMPVASVN